MAEAKKTIKKTTKAKLVAEAVDTADAPEVIIEKEVVAKDAPVKATAKAGKKSAKVIAEVEEKQAKAERKTKPVEAKVAAKPTKNPTRPKAERAGKKYREAIANIDKTKTYSLKDALELVTKTSTTKFDATVELHVNLGVDPTQADQNIRGTVTLPAGTGKTIRIAVVADTADDAKAKAAGADLVGADAIFADLDKEKIDFDILVATPAMMPKLGKYARLLGPRGLMPNPKSGTVAADVAAAVTAAKAGRVEYKVDQTGIIHLGTGKVSFGTEKLLTNAEAVLSSIKAAKPASLKDSYIKTIYVTSSMGPSVQVENLN